MARASRYFLGRAVRYLAAEAGIRQFLDIGTGLPTVDNTHEVAQRVAPESRIVYVDNDPLVLAHARALLSSTREGATNYVDADLYEPDKILQAAGRILDFNRPIALMLMGIMGHVPEESAQPIVDQLVAGLPSGSHLVLYDGANVSEPFVEAQRRYNEGGSVPYILRSPSGSPSSSTAWKSSTPVWSPARAGGPTPVRSSPRAARRPTAASATNRKPHPNPGL